MKHFTVIAMTILFIQVSKAGADSNKEQSPIGGLFGSKAIQLSVGADGIKQKKEPGYICDIDATLGGGHYSEWGETEKDARTIVMKTCDKNSGALLCKEEKITCKQEK
jgi:hypothetical protein